MMRRLNVYTICLVIGLSILIIINIGLQYTENGYYQIPIKNRRSIKIILKVEDGEDTYTQQIPIVSDGNLSLKHINMDNILETTNENNSFELDQQQKHSNKNNKTRSSAEIEKILERARTKIKDDVSNYNFSQSGVNGLEDLLIESGGQPLRTLIISTWRSGSTYLAELVNAVTYSTYYHYEPLIMFGIKQFTDRKKSAKQVRMVKQMFKCNFYGLEDFIEFQREDLTLFNHPTRLYDYCKDENGSQLCFNAEFTSRLCKLFPFQSMKLVRLRSRPTEEILKDKELNVKVILLVRDPRGVMQSRRHLHFCKNPDCSDPYLVCADMVGDYIHAKEFLQKYPGRLMTLRFEDLALKPNATADRILKFLNLDRTKVFDEFLQSHTTVEIPGFQSTSKVSRNIPYKWKTTLDFKSVHKIQMACQEAMRVWGYKMAYNETHMTSDDFNPYLPFIEDYTI